MAYLDVDLANNSNRCKTCMSFEGASGEACGSHQLPHHIRLSTGSWSSKNSPKMSRSLKIWVAQVSGMLHGSRVQETNQSNVNKWTTMQCIAAAVSRPSPQSCRTKLKNSPELREVRWAAKFYGHRPRMQGATQTRRPKPNCSEKQCLFWTCIYYTIISAWCVCVNSRLETKTIKFNHISKSYPQVYPYHIPSINHHMAAALPCLVIGCDHFSPYWKFHQQLPATGEHFEDLQHENEFTPMRVKYSAGRGQRDYRYGRLWNHANGVTSFSYKCRLDKQNKPIRFRFWILFDSKSGISFGCWMSIWTLLRHTHVPAKTDGWFLSSK